jgi:hypothetical protein
MMTRRFFYNVFFCNLFLVVISSYYLVITYLENPWKKPA